MLPSPSVSSSSPCSALHTLSNNDTSKDARLSSVRADLHKALRLLNHSPAAKSFLLAPFEPSSQLGLLTSSHPSFTIATKEEQEGALPGQIGLSYLGLPAFSDREGLSGGLVVTRYATRTHPLHDPSFIADVRVGRYVRDDASGEWCMITRSGKDRIVRLQYMHVNPQGDRERISLTCDTHLFDCGRHTDSVYFRCHDHEWHKCPMRSRCDCRCQNAVGLTYRSQTGLVAAAHNFIREGAREWVGTVRVTVVNRFSIVPLLDVDDIMTVRSTYKAGVDGALSSQIRHLAVLETMSQSQSSLTIHCSIPQNTEIGPKGPEFSKDNEDIGPAHFDSLHSGVPSLPLTPPLTPTKMTELIDEEFSSFVPSSATMPWSPDLMCEDLFGTSGSDEVADHFLVAKDLPLSYFDDNDAEYPMLPADLSTLPAGVESCLDGMDLEDLDDDCFSLMTSERDTHSVSSALSTAGSDGVPSLDSVPMPGDDVLDAISALNLSSPVEGNNKDPSGRPLVEKKATEENLFEQSLDGLSNPAHRDVCALSMNGAVPSASWQSNQFKTSNVPNINFESKLPSLDSLEAASFGHVLDTSNPTPKEKTKLSRTSQDNDAPPTVEALTPVNNSSPQNCSDAALSVNEKLGPGPETNTITLTIQTPIYEAPHRDACATIRSNIDVANVASEYVSTYPQPIFPIIAPTQSIAIGHGHSLSVLSPPSYQALYGRSVSAVAIDGLERKGLNVAHGQPTITNDHCWAVGVQERLANGVRLSTCPAGRGGEALRLAPRPPGMKVAYGPIWNLSPVYGSDQWVTVSRLEAIEKERKAEERRKKNRQAAARSNAKKKNLMDGIRSEISKYKNRAEYLKSVQAKLRNENGSLRKRILDLECEQESK